MSVQLKKWIPIAVCCLPGVAIVAVVGIGAALGGAFLSGPLGIGLVALAILACPLSMALMMRRGSNQKSASGGSHMLADCCAPDEQAARQESDQLAALRQRRQTLEREVAELRHAH